MAASTNLVTTFRFEQEVRDELDLIQEQLGKKTWSQTVAHIILDYRRLVDELVKTNHAHRNLEMKYLRQQARVVKFKSSLDDLLDLKE